MKIQDDQASSRIKKYNQQFQSLLIQNQPENNIVYPATVPTSHASNKQPSRTSTSVTRRGSKKVKNLIRSQHVAVQNQN